jgi:hypothetical protein
MLQNVTTCASANQLSLLFVAASATQITFQPYACRLLDTLRRLAVYALMLTLFMMMLITVSESEDRGRLALACMIIVAVVNAAVVGVHLWMCVKEVRRWLAWKAGKVAGDKLTWRDIKQLLPVSMVCGGVACMPCGRRGAGQQQQSQTHQGAQHQGTAGMASGSAVGVQAGQPVEMASNDSLPSIAGMRV